MSPRSCKKTIKSPLYLDNFVFLTNKINKYNAIKRPCVSNMRFPENFRQSYSILINLSLIRHHLIAN